jgi:hypothetical protein
MSVKVYCRKCGNEMSELLSKAFVAGKVRVDTREVGCVNKTCHEGSRVIVQYTEPIVRKGLIQWWMVTKSKLTRNQGGLSCH